MISPNISYETALKILQKVYEQQKENKNLTDKELNDCVLPILESNKFKGTIPIKDSGNITINPTVNTQMTTKKAGTIVPIDVHYTYKDTFTVPKQYLGFLGFESYFQTSGTDTLSAGAVFQGDVWQPDIYEIIADGTTVWKGPFPPSDYMGLLDYKTAQQALYNAPAWNVTVPTGSSQGTAGSPSPGKYRVLGFLAFDNISHITPNNSGSYWAGSMFLATSVTNISGGNFTGHGILLTNTAKSQWQEILDLPQGGPYVPQSITTGTWPQAWINPNDLFHPNPALTPIIPGQYVLYTGGKWDGTAIYQSYSPQFITPNSLFVGCSNIAPFPTIVQFTTALEGLGESPSTAASQAYKAWWQLYAKFGNDLGAPNNANITNAYNAGSGWEAIRSPGDMGLTGFNAQEQQLIFNMMWQNYVNGGQPFWLYCGNVGSGANLQMWPEARITYGVTKTYSLANMRLLFLNTTGAAGGERSFPNGDQTIWPLTSDANAQNIRPSPFGTSPYLSGLWPWSSNWTYSIAGWQAFYDSNYCVHLFVQNQSSNPNIGRPDQNQSLAGYLALGESLYDQPGLNHACANYYFPYTSVEMKLNDPTYYPTTVQETAAVLDNTFDPVFIRLSKSTDKQEKWGCFYYYSAILLSPSVKQNSRTYKQWDDVVNFYFTYTSTGYIINGMEGLGPYDAGSASLDPLYLDRSGPFQITSGPALYTDVTPNTTSHNSTSVDINYPNANPVITRVKVNLKTPNNWHQIPKFVTQKS